MKRKPSRRNSNAIGTTLAQVTIPDTKSVVRHHGGPVVGDGTNNDTTFYITLTIEQDDDDDDPLERIDSKYILLRRMQSIFVVSTNSTYTNVLFSYDFFYQF